jgi:hypothetical protein
MQTFQETLFGNIETNDDISVGKIYCSTLTASLNNLPYPKNGLEEIMDVRRLYWVCEIEQP